MGPQKRYPKESRERSARLVAESRSDHESEREAICSMAVKLGYTHETLRRWVRCSQTGSGRVQWEDYLRGEITRVWEENFRVNGAREVWRQLVREGIAAARCTVERLMKNMGLAGAVRGRTKVTTAADTSQSKLPDLVNRKFSATGPNQLWISDFT